MPTPPLHYPEHVNLDNCAKEPIHIIGKTQSHGVLLVCDPKDLKITQIGENAPEFFGAAAGDLLGKNLSFLLKNGQEEKIEEFLGSEEVAVPQEVDVNGKKFLMLPHLSGANVVIDFEPFQEVKDPYHFQRQLTLVLNKFQEAKSVDQLCRAAANLTREMLGYDRVMIYRFDEEWNGEVIAEAREEDMEPWLGLHYPATDIPAQSRRLFLKHRVRMIANVHYNPVPIKPEISPITGEPVDISKSNLRAVSPIHIEYLKNMGVGASLSAAIVVKGKLWGLIACHHKTAKNLDFYHRESCRFLAQMLSTELMLHEATGLISQNKLSESIKKQLVVQMKQHKDVVAALAEGNVKFTQLISCGGGAIFLNGRWQLSGNTPTREQVESLLDNFVKAQPKSLFLTRTLSAAFPEAEAYRDTASGLLSLKIAENKFILWFKPEVVQVVDWGGDPRNKAFYNEKEQRLSPRQSFEKWSEKLTGVSEPWQEIDKAMARSLRENVSHILLAQQRAEIEALNGQLVEANNELELFSYGLSHDLRAPVRGIEGFLNILKEDHEEALDDDARQLVGMSKGLIVKMNDLIDNILEYSRLNHLDDPELEEIGTSELIDEVLEFINVKGSYPATEVKVQQKLPNMIGDRRMLFQLWVNLISNALKYSANEQQPQVEIGASESAGENTFFVKDNGIGIPKDLQEKVFEIFTRAVGSKFKGTGIGLAIVKKIVEKHQGGVWVESEPGKGSEFYFYLGTFGKERKEA